MGKLADDFAAVEPERVVPFRDWLDGLDRDDRDVVERWLADRTIPHTWIAERCAEAGHPHVTSKKVEYERKRRG
jgi:hypothetical protein